MFLSLQVFSALTSLRNPWEFLAGLTSKAERHEQRLAHVAAVYAEHLAQGQPITSSKTLARAAHVRIETALEFLRIERSKSV